MTTLLIITSIVIIFWIIYGRGALIAYRHKKDEGVLLPQELNNKDDIIVFLKKELSYKEIKDIYFDENGNICIEGKYGAYCVHIKDEMLCVDKEIFSATVATSSIRQFIKLFNRKNAKRTEELECIRAYIVKIFDHDAPINAHQKYTAMKRAHKWSTWLSGILTVFIVALIISAFSNENSTVNLVRNGHFTSYSSKITVGEAFEDFFADTEWISYEEDDDEYVKFSGDCTWNGEKADIYITFEIDGERFNIDEIVLYVKGKRITNLDYEYIINEIYDHYD